MDRDNNACVIPLWSNRADRDCPPGALDEDRLVRCSTCNDWFQLHVTHPFSSATMVRWLDEVMEMKCPICLAKEKRN